MKSVLFGVKIKLNRSVHRIATRHESSVTYRVQTYSSPSYINASPTCIPIGRCTV